MRGKYPREDRNILKKGRDVFERGDIYLRRDRDVLRGSGGATH